MSDDVADTVPIVLVGESLDLRSIGADTSPAIRFVNSTLYDALKTGAPTSTSRATPVA